MYYNMTKNEIKQNKLDMVEWLVSRPTEGERWRKYYNGNVLTAARLTGGELVKIEKLHMETSFCYGYGMNGCDFDNDHERAARCCDAVRDSFYWFLEENLRECKRSLKWLRSRLEYLSMFGDTPYLVVITNDRQTYVQDIDKFSHYLQYMSEENALKYSGENATLRKLTKRDIEILIAAYKVQLADIAKRCKTYWKRYGGSKLHTWTYLID